MKRLNLALAALVLVLPPTRAAEPQPGTKLALVRDPKVLKDLKVTDAQASKLKDAKDEASLLAALRVEQLKQLTQISYATRGGAALMDEAVQNELALTDAQKADAKRIWTRKEVELGMFLKVARFRNAQARTNYILDKRKGAGEALLGLLTDAQRKTFAAMQGK